MRVVAYADDKWEKLRTGARISKLLQKTQTTQYGLEMTNKHTIKEEIGNKVWKGGQFM